MCKYATNLTDVPRPHFLAVWQSKEVAVHLYMDPPLFTGMLTATLHAN